ncbi:MAG: DUF2892 domain-containing protein [Bacteroidales bacterium]|jgi:type IV secretory pathway TrbD component|nr:DUF2892 domain-containing protein [Bacteroidales bacterium]MDD3700531.1 DUF2892 domain-containing protein [Bacteroidales bacterium]MDY0370493.1 DUF2892 domain-containing protein [Bacteroidales bacterium]
MKKNIGNIDRTIRILLGLVIGVLGVVYHTWWGLLGLIPLVTAFISFCPIYSLFKISTVEKKQTSKEA